MFGPNAESQIPIDTSSPYKTKYLLLRQSQESYLQNWYPLRLLIGQLNYSKFMRVAGTQSRKHICALKITTKEC